MHVVVRCFSCNEPVRLPDTESAIWVRCPLCGDDYPIDKVLDELPPALVPVAAPAMGDIPLGGDDTDSLTEPRAATDFADHANRPEAAPKVARRPDDDVAPNIPSPEKLHAERRSNQVRRPRGDSPQGSFMKVVLGGVAGLCIGQLILWWLPKSMRTDPFELAPRLPDAMAFLAPAELRAPLFSDSDDRSVDGGEDHEEPVAAPEEAQPSATSDAKDDQLPEPRDMVLGLIDAPTIRMAQLRNALSAAETATSSFLQGKIDDGAKDSWCEKINDLAFSVTFGDMSDPDIQEFAKDAKQFLHRVAGEAVATKALGERSVSAISSAAHHRNGIVVVGRVAGVQSAGSLFKTDVVVDGTNAKIQVISRIHPLEKRVYAIDDQVLIAGVVVSEPSIYLLGYQGKAQAVVLGGLPIKY